MSISRAEFKELFDKSVLNITTGIPIKNIISEKLNSLTENKINPIFKTGLTDLDLAINTIEVGNLIVIAGRPSMGKTALLHTIIINSIPQNIPLAFFTFSDTIHYTTKKMMASVSGLSYREISAPKTEKTVEHIKNCVQKLADAPIFLEDFSKLTITDLKLRIHKLSHEGVKYIFIDNLQNIVYDTDDNLTEVQKQKNVVKELKDLTKYLEVAIIITANLSRRVDIRGGDKRPILSDIRDYSSLEYFADIIIFIYRAENYGLTEDENGYSTKDKAELIIAKNRNGRQAVIDVKFLPKLTYFKDIN